MIANQDHRPSPAGSPDKVVCAFKERYVIGKTLGAGEFATVKAAVDRRTNEKVAIKLIRAASSPQRREQLQRELTILKRLCHKHIPRVTDIVAMENGKQAVVMEYAGRGELFHLVQQRGRLRAREALLYFVQLLSAVDYLHAIGIVHRDIKLENILVHEDGRLLLSDFGFATTCEKAKLLHTACGSPNYAAPEIIFDAIGYDGFAADVWSLGVVLYGMLCGCLPFDDEQHRRLQMAEHRKADPHFVESDTNPINVRCLYNYIVSSPLQFPTCSGQSVDILAVDLVRAMLQPDPIKRITIFEIWKHPWLNN